MVSIMNGTKEYLQKTGAIQRKFFRGEGKNASGGELVHDTSHKIDILSNNEKPRGGPWGEAAPLSRL